jgi:hypothetical protein
MKSTEAGLRFPVLAFTADNRLWGIETLDIFTRCGPFTLKDGAQLGMRIVDSDWRCWKVTSVRELGRDRAMLPWLLARLVSAPGYRIEQELEPMAPLSLEQMRGQVSASLREHADDYGGYDGDEADFRRLLAEIGKAGSVADVLKAIGPDDFRGN